MLPLSFSVTGKRHLAVGEPNFSIRRVFLLALSFALCASAADMRERTFSSFSRSEK